MIWYPERIFSNGLKPIVQTIVLLLRMDNEVRRIVITGVPIWVCTNQDIESYILKPDNISALWEQASPVVNMCSSIAALIPLNCLDFMEYGRKES
jgi:ABC-type xylose transport system permease subunit